MDSKDTTSADRLSVSDTVDPAHRQTEDRPVVRMLGPNIFDFL